MTTPDAERDPEAGLGHDYDGPELRSGTPEYEALYAEYQAWAAQPEPEAELEPDAETYGPKLPDMHDLYLAQGRTVDSASLVLSHAEYDQLVAERQQTETAYLARYDRDLEAEAASEPEPELEAEL